MVTLLTSGSMSSPNP